MLKVKGVLFRALHSFVKDSFGNRGEHEVSRRLKKASRDAFEKPILTQLYMVMFYEEVLNAIKDFSGFDYDEIGREIFKYIKGMILDSLGISSYEDLLLSANKISSYMLDGLSWKVETLEKGKSYLITIKSPYALASHVAFWKSAFGFVLELLKSYKVENPKISLQNFDFNEIRLKLEV